jgi:predicted HD superfamily hydrolase involved in NAD metabolism
MDFTRIEHYVATQVSATRYSHCLSAARETIALLQRYVPGFTDFDSARLAGVWHDVARQWTDGELLSYAQEQGIPMEDEEVRYPMLLHGPVASRLLEQQMPQVDEAVKLAIRWHTIGSVAMGLLGAALFVADYMEPLRRHLHPGERDTLLESKSLEGICLRVVESHLAHLEHKGKEGAATTQALAVYLIGGGTFS